MDTMSSNKSDKLTQIFSSYKIMMCIFRTTFINFFQSRTTKTQKKSYAEVNTTAVINNSYAVYVYMQPSAIKISASLGEKNLEEKLNKNEISLEISREEFIKRKLLKKYDQLVMLVDIKEEMVVETNDSMLDKSKRDRKRSEKQN